MYLRENTAYKRPFTVEYGTKTAVYDKVTAIYDDSFWPTWVFTSGGATGGATGS